MTTTTTVHAAPIAGGIQNLLTMKPTLCLELSTGTVTHHDDDGSYQGCSRASVQFFFGPDELPAAVAALRALTDKAEALLPAEVPA